MATKSPLDDIIQQLKSKTGNDFAASVRDAFIYLGFDAEKIEETQAESDVIAKASLAQRPYFVVIECNAVREGEQVGYQKLGQIRGNFPKYVARYGKDFLSSYKVIIGRPLFSKDAKKLASPDIVLITVDNLVKLLNAHNQFYFSQDELESIFTSYGEVTEQKIYLLTQPFLKKLKSYALIYMSLLQEPTSKPNERKKGWISVQQLIGSVKQIGWFLNISDITEADIIYALRDLSSPLLKVVETINEEDKVRLTSISLEVIVSRMQELGKIFYQTLTDFQKLAINQRLKTGTN